MALLATAVVLSATVVVLTRPGSDEPGVDAARAGGHATTTSTDASARAEIDTAASAEPDETVHLTELRSSIGAIGEFSGRCGRDGTAAIIYRVDPNAADTIVVQDGRGASSGRVVLPGDSLTDVNAGPGLERWVVRMGTGAEDLSTEVWVSYVKAIGATACEFRVWGATTVTPW